MLSLLCYSTTLQSDSRVTFSCLHALQFIVSVQWWRHLFVCQLHWAWRHPGVCLPLILQHQRTTARSPVWESEPRTVTSAVATSAAVNPTPVFRRSQHFRSQTINWSVAKQKHAFLDSGRVMIECYAHCSSCCCQIFENFWRLWLGFFQDLPGPKWFFGTFQVMEFSIKIQDFAGGVGTLFIAFYLCEMEMKMQRR